MKNLNNNNSSEKKLTDIFTELYQDPQLGLEFFENLKLEVIKGDDGKFDLKVKNEQNRKILFSNALFKNRLTQETLLELARWGKELVFLQVAVVHFFRLRELQLNILNKKGNVRIQEQKIKVDNKYLLIFDKLFIIKFVLRYPSVEKFFNKYHYFISGLMSGTDAEAEARILADICSDNMQLAKILFNNDEIGKSREFWKNLKIGFLESKEHVSLLINVFVALAGRKGLTDENGTLLNDIFYANIERFEKNNIHENYLKLAESSYLAELILSRYFLNVKRDLILKEIPIETIVAIGLKQPKLAQMIIRLIPKELIFNEKLKPLLIPLEQCVKMLHYPSMLTYAFMQFAGYGIEQDIEAAITSCVDLFQEHAYKPALRLLKAFTDCFKSGECFSTYSSSLDGINFKVSYSAELIGKPIPKDLIRAESIYQLIITRSKEENSILIEEIEKEADNYNYCRALVGKYFESGDYWRAFKKISNFKTTEVKWHIALFFANTVKDLENNFKAKIAEFQQEQVNNHENFISRFSIFEFDYLDISAKLLELKQPKPACQVFIHLAKLNPAIYREKALFCEQIAIANLLQQNYLQAYYLMKQLSLHNPENKKYAGYLNDWPKLMDKESVERSDKQIFEIAIIERSQEILCILPFYQAASKAGSKDAYKIVQQLEQEQLSLNSPASNLPTWNTSSYSSDSKSNAPKRQLPGVGNVACLAAGATAFGGHH